MTQTWNGGGADGTGTAGATIEYDEDGTDKVVVSGASWQFNCGIGITGGTTIDNIQIKQDTIASTSGDTMFIDPFPDGLSSEGLLVIKVVYKSMELQLQLIQQMQL